MIFHFKFQITLRLQCFQTINYYSQHLHVICKPQKSIKYCVYYYHDNRKILLSSWLFIQHPESTGKKSLAVTTQDSNRQTSDPFLTIWLRLLCHIVQNSGWENLGYNLAKQMCLCQYFLLRFTKLFFAKTLKWSICQNITPPELCTIRYGIWLGNMGDWLGYSNRIVTMLQVDVYCKLIYRKSIAKK